MLLVSGEGLLLAANREVEKRLQVPARQMCGRPLSDFVSDPPEALARYLSACSRTKDPLPGSLVLKPSEGGEIPCRVEGGVIQPRTATEAAVIQLRFFPRSVMPSQFALLNQRIDELSREITARKRAEAELRRSEELLTTTLRSIGDAVIATDREGCVTFMNVVAEQLTGWTETEAQGQPASNVFHIINEHTRQRAENPIARVLSEGVIVGLANHTLLIARDGTEHPIDDSGAPIQTTEGAILGAVLVFRDISEKKRAEVALLENEQRLRLALDAGKCGTWDWDIVRNHIIWSERVYEFHGMTPETFGGKLEDFTHLIHPEDVGWVGDAIRRAVQERTPFEIEFRVRQPSGRVRWLYTSGRVLYNTQGQPVRMLGATIDTTERRRAQETLQLQARVLESMTEGVSLSDEQGIIVYTNPAEDAIFGYEPGELIGQHVTVQNAYAPEENRRIVSQIIAELKTRGSWSGEFLNCKKDGTPFTTYAHITRLDIEGKPHWVCVQDDITEQKLAREALRESEERYARASRAGKVGVWEWQVDTNDLYLSPDLKSMLGYTGEELPNALDAWADLVHPDDVERVVSATRAYLDGNAPQYEVEVRRKHKDGYYLWFLARGTVIRDENGTPVRMTGSDTDIMEIKELNQRLQRAMSETHHRVKNNLQVITALVNMQITQHRTMVPVMELKRVIQHIQALAAIHDLLTHQAKTSAEVEDLSIKQAIEKLMPILQAMIHDRRLVASIQDVRLPIRQGTSLAVLINELVSNAIKHGEGEISILFAAVDGFGCLEVQDNGPGFPDGFDPKIAANTGLELIESLATWDLRGTTRYGNRPQGGARVVVQFPLSEMPHPTVEPATTKEQSLPANTQPPRL